VTGTSARENLADVRAFVEGLGGSGYSLNVLDVGAGQGTYADALAGLPIILEAIEAWEPAAARLRDDDRYTFVYQYDVRARPVLFRGTLDVVIFGDVLEHMSIHDAHVVWDGAYSCGAWVIVSVPNSPYPQGAIDGNHLEEHLILDPVRELIAFLPEPQQVWEYPVTNTYLWKKED
jgi:hypothetical protein